MMSLLRHRYAKLMRLDKPVGYILLLLPCLWAIAFAAKTYQQMIFPAIIFSAGAIIMRSAGCIINDIIDRDLDAEVERTKTRPLANGTVSLKEALILVAILLALALALLYLLPQEARYIGVFSIIPITIYPLMKRFHYYPQVFLGFVFNLGVLMAWFSTSQIPSIVALLLYIAAVCWTIGYDTIYAFQDIEDDIKIGVKSLAIKYGENAPKMIWKLYQFVIIALMLVGLNMQLNFGFYLIALIGWYHLYWQVEYWDLKSPKDCALRFRSNTLFGIIMLLAILIGKYHA